MPNHRWGKRVPLEHQTERTCVRCGLVKVTVHPPLGLPWREWRMPGQVQVQLEATPPCVDVEA